MLWLFQVFALTAGLYGCQTWATSMLSLHASSTSQPHIHHTCFLRSLLGVKKGTRTECLLRETGQMPLFFYWFRCILRFWNSSLKSNNGMLHAVVRADLRLVTHKRSWTHDVLQALNHLPTSQPFSECILAQTPISISSFEAALRDHIIQEWRNLHDIPPHEAHSTSRIQRTYHTHFGSLLSNKTGCWDDKCSKRPPLPHYLRLDLPQHLSRSLSSLRLSSHKLRVETLRHQPSRRPYELRVCNKCDWHTVQDEEHILFDCPSRDLVELRKEFRTFLDVVPQHSVSRLRGFFSQDDVAGVAKYVHACLSCFA